MNSIEKALRLKTELDSLRPINKEQEAIIMQKFRLDWNYHSNHLEGNSLTFGETKALILFGITAQGKPLKDHFEITGHNEAINEVIEVVKSERPLTETFIRELHTLLLKEPYEVDAVTSDGLPTKKRIKVGKYKTLPNHVQTKTGEIFRFASPEETPALMNDLLQWHNEKRKATEVNPIILAAEFHYRFIRIHPFDDGNGRVARILMNFVLMQFGYPPTIIRTDDKENYFIALMQADTGAIEPFIEYIAKNVVRSLEIMLAGAKGESIEEPDDLDKEIALLEQKVKGVRKKIEIHKSKESILEIYDDTIARLTLSMINACKKFDKFYLQTEFRFSLDYIERSNNLFDVLKVNRGFVDGNTSNINLYYNFLKFNQEGFGEFNHQIAVYIQFELSFYSVTTNGSNTIEKPYEEQLSNEEFDDLIKQETRKHKELIEYKLNEIKKKKR
ncbi:MAG: Fic family protein [Ignavibacteriales bacterium]|nr:Fic family protein [Ignavibacteriales bacterium]